MNIEVGKAYRTRSGLKAVISSTHEGGYYPFMGDVHGFENGATAWHSWMRNGTWRIKDTNELDLIAEWQEPEPELKIEAGKFYKRRSGEKCLVPYINPDGSFYSFDIGWSGDMDDVAWGHTGKRGGCICESSDDSNDIIGPWIDPPKPLEFWANVYRDNGLLTCVGNLHLTKEAAEKVSKDAIRTSLFREVL